MEKKVYKVIIIGAGPAGLTAAIYTARASLSPLVLAGSKWGGQLMLTTDVENYPGFPAGTQGPELMRLFRNQAESFGVEILNEDVTAVDFKSRPLEITAGSNSYRSESVIIATGSKSKWLNLPNEQRLIGRGVSSCAPCDAFFFKNKKVVVVGGGDSAMEEALTLTKFATSVAIIHRRDEFRASKIMIERVRANKKISFILNSVVTDILGKDNVEGVKIKNKIDGSERKIQVDGVFIAIGHLPTSELFKGKVELDEKGYIKKIRNSKFEIRNEKGKVIGNQYKMMTSVEGVFVAGDVHDYHYRQAVTAAAYGCMAAMEAERWLESRE